MLHTPEILRLESDWQTCNHESGKKETPVSGYGFADGIHSGEGECIPDRSVSENRGTKGHINR